MARSRRVKGTASARTEGARRATGVGADGAAVGLGALVPGQRWSASRKRDVVLRLLRGESLDAVSREVGVEVYRLEAWKARALAGLELGLISPQFSWTRIKGESDVTGSRGHGSVETGEGNRVGADGGSPEGDRSQRRRRGGWVGGLGARPAVERKPETGRGVAAAARRVAGHGLARSRSGSLSPGVEMATRKGLPTILQVPFCGVVTAVEMGVR